MEDSPISPMPLETAEDATIRMPTDEVWVLKAYDMQYDEVDLHNAA